MQTQELEKRVKSAGKNSAAIRKMFGEYLPARPAFGDRGQKIIVWANCFSVSAKPITLYKYGLKINKVIPVEEKKAKGFKEPEIRGRKLQFVIAKLLEVIRDGPDQALRDAQAFVKQAEQALKEAQKGGDGQAVADAQGQLEKGKAHVAEVKKNSAAAKKSNKLVVSEFKSQIVSLEELQLNHNPVRVVLSEPALEDGAPPRQDNYDVELMEPVAVPVSDVLNHVASMKVDTNDTVFPRHPEVIDVLNMILGFRPRSEIERVSVVGSSRFYPFGSDAQIEQLQVDYRPLVAARGFFQSTRLATGRLLLNTQVTHGVFKLAGQATKIFDQMNFGPRKTPQQAQDYRMIKTIKAFSKCLSKVRATVTFRTASGREVKRVKAIEGLVFASEMARKRTNKGPNADKFEAGYELCGPGQVSFWNAEDKKYVTVKQHFEKKYGLKLGNYPVFNFGHGDKNSYFPAEVVEIQAGQQAKLKLTGKETTAMLNFACRTPYSNAKTLVEESRDRLGHDDPMLQQLGVAVSKNLLAVHARVIVPPRIQYQKGASVQPAFGSWNMRNVRVLRSGKPFERWGYMNILAHNNVPSIDINKIKFMIECWQTMGVNISNAPGVWKEYTKQQLGSSQMDEFFKDCKSKRLQLIVFILPEKDSGGLYNQIKTLGDCVYGIHTSCVVVKQLEKGQQMTMANLGLKVNLKAGGVNHKLSEDLDILKEGKTMFVGYDVTHPTNMDLPKNGTGPPSLVGLVSSVDSDLGQWPSVTWEQASKQEILGNILESHFASRIDLWQQHNKNKRLENIVIYRDGVSESQFSQVLIHELPLIRAACEKKFPDGSPKLTIIVSVKRHQTRFYPADGENKTRSGNIKNGTVVDRGVTQVRYWDFYLTAHDALKGTARPAHYTVLLDEIFRPRYDKNAANALEKVTHELCYLFGRATKAVSICPPAYYADLVCERARAHRPEYAGPDDSASEVSGSGSHRPPQTREIHEELRNSMFYI